MLAKAILGETEEGLLSHLMRGSTGNINCKNEMIIYEDDQMNEAGDDTDSVLTA